MRFPFFATNTRLNRFQGFCAGRREAIKDQCTKDFQDFMDLKQKVLVLEGRINTLEVWKNHGRKKGK